MRTVGAVTFPDFELLDVQGLLPEDFGIRMIGASHPSEVSAQGPRTVIDDLRSDAKSYDVVLVPGGRGTRASVEDAEFIDWLTEVAGKAELVAVVCTGTALVARTGLLDGHKATTNKAAYHWVTTQGPRVDWQPKARWVHSGKFFTSSGVAAGIDMSLALIAHLLGEAKAEETAKWAEYDWHRDADWDPFAAIHGLV